MWKTWGRKIWKTSRNLTINVSEFSLFRVHPVFTIFKTLSISKKISSLLSFAIYSICYYMNTCILITISILISFFEIVWPHYPSSIYRHLLNYSSFPAKAGELIGSLDIADRSTWLERWPKPQACVHIGLWSRWQPLIANVERKYVDKNLICCQVFDLRDTQNLGLNFFSVGKQKFTPDLKIFREIIL